MTQIWHALMQVGLYRLGGGWSVHSSLGLSFQGWGGIDSIKGAESKWNPSKVDLNSCAGTHVYMCVTYEQLPCSDRGMHLLE